MDTIITEDGAYILEPVKECKVEAIQVKLYKRNNYGYTPDTKDSENGKISEAGSPLSNPTPRA